MSIREPEKKSFFKKLVNGLSKTRNKLVTGLESTFMAYSVIDDEFYDELEEILIMSDLGVQTAEEVIEDLKQQVEQKYIGTPSRCRDLLIDILKDKMAVPEDAYDFERQQSVVFIIGVNGVGKTTSCGKLAASYRLKGKKVLIAACDTFRAAAIEQL
ncbi:MAG: signal recognition particle receptor subunit alpha, partial [Lachnospiraceae bacterium]|nr:signal recognition particle receptor subunit alpha [Lachnospiraceae bacterium]